MDEWRWSAAAPPDPLVQKHSASFSRLFWTTNRLQPHLVCLSNFPTEHKPDKDYVQAMLRTSRRRRLAGLRRAVNRVLLAKAAGGAAARRRTPPPAAPA